MALIKCSECQKEISDKAKACPNCGCPVHKIIGDTHYNEEFNDVTNQPEPVPAIDDIRYAKETIDLFLRPIHDFVQNIVQTIKDVGPNYGKTPIREDISNQIDTKAGNQNEVRGAVSAESGFSILLREFFNRNKKIIVKAIFILSGISILSGAGAIIYGITQNNSFAAHLKYAIDKGYGDPGDIFITMGVTGIITGFMLAALIRLSGVVGIITDFIIRIISKAITVKTIFILFGIGTISYSVIQNAYGIFIIGIIGIITGFIILVVSKAITIKKVLIVSGIYILSLAGAIIYEVTTIIIVIGIAGIIGIIIGFIIRFIIRLIRKNLK